MSALRTVILALTLAACSSPTPEPVAIAIETTPEPQASYPSYTVVPVAIAVEHWPDRCDPLLVKKTDQGPRLSKRRPAWLPHERRRAAMQAWTRGVIAIVVDELGGDDLALELLYRKAIQESSGNPHAVHILDPDVEANETWSSFGRRHASERWAKARVPLHVADDGELIPAIGHSGKPITTDAWALGRGLYGMVTGLFMRRWSPDAPPWSLCDPAIATTVAIWSMRSSQLRCKSSTLRSAYRWISAGRCSERSPTLERRWDRLARGKVRGLRLERIRPDAEVDFGARWPAASADRAELLAVLHRRIAEELGPPPE